MGSKKRSLRKKVSLGLTAALMTASLTALPPAQPAEAFDLASAIGAVIGVSAQYAALNKQIAYFDGEGRNAYMNQVKDKEGVNDDPQANAMLDRVMSRLSTAIAKTDPDIEKEPYNYFVNNNTNFNAYCTLGHNVSVNIGLFDTLNYNEDEIAFVLGHEMGHGQRKDPANGVKKNMPISLLAAIAESQSNGLEALGTALLANLGSAKLVTLPMEKKADELGFTYASDANYNPGAGSALWQRVIEKMGTSKETFLGSVFNPSDHPGNESRRDKYTERMYAYSGNRVNVDKKTGDILLNKKAVGIPAATDSMSARERSYLVAGRLARIYHDEPEANYNASTDGESLYFGSTPIMTLTESDNGETWVTNLNTAAAIKDPKAEKARQEAKAKEEKARKAAEAKAEKAKQKELKKAKDQQKSAETTSTQPSGKTFKERVAELQKQQSLLRDER